MPLSFLNKPNCTNLDFSVFLEYPPDVIVEFFQHTDVNIELIAYHGLKQLFADSEDTNENVTKWILFIDKLLDMEDALEYLNENSYVNFVGPAYYTKTNTRFFFLKPQFELETITVSDIAELIELNSTPNIDETVAKYYANMKTNNYGRKTREDLLNDLRTCIIALNAIEMVQRQIDFERKLTEAREKFLSAPYAALIEPEQPTGKPEKPSREGFKISKWLNRGKKQSISYEEACQNYQHELKVYYVNYREYEKACDRYKNALREWETEKNHLINRSIEDIKKAKLKIKKGNRLLKIYNEVLNNLGIHPCYQNLDSLNRFQYFIQTGRANTLQDCMNLYEQELHWEKLQESQSRLERNIMATVYYLQSEAAATLEQKPKPGVEHILESIVSKLRDQN